jgi:hypothetical protein
MRSCRAPIMSPSPMELDPNDVVATPAGPVIAAGRVRRRGMPPFFWIGARVLLPMPRLAAAQTCTRRSGPVHVPVVVCSS